ncbi:MAG TPA: hypothetical protein VM099_14115 [Gemmatimonadaceae bacterium]|nr:hypothetical protein [Gemmatimonadaceae bacterium]
MRHMLSLHSSYTSQKAIRLLGASVAVAGLVTLAACADNGAEKTLTAPTGPRNATTQTTGFGFAAQIQLCVSSPVAGTYQFTNSGWNNGVDLNGAIDPGDGGDFLAPNNGSTVWTPAKGDATPYTVAVGSSCNTIVQRTQESLHEFSFDPLFNFGPTQTDDYQAVNITLASYPAGAVFDHVDCILDSGVAPPSPCDASSLTTRALANMDHGVQITYVFVAGTGHNCTFTQGYYKNHESYTAGVLNGNLNTTYIDGSAKLKIGGYLLNAAQIDLILETAVGKGYNAGGVTFTKDQLAMIHQLITAELNIAGGAAPASISAIITAANLGYTSASKTQLSSWTNSLDGFNNGKLGPNHCS